MNTNQFKGNILLLTTAIIWGLEFVTQKIGAAHLNVFTFNGIKFALGSLTLIPFILYSHKNKNEIIIPLSTVLYGVVAGGILFLSSTTQQASLYYISAGKAAFLTGMYVVLVPLIEFFLHKKNSKNLWVGSFLAICGLYLLSFHENLNINKGDLIAIFSALFWSLHILIIGHASKSQEILKLAFIQFVTCFILNDIFSLILGKNSLYEILQTSVPLLYGGIFSVGCAFTFQAMGQKLSKPSHAAIILCMEALFATIGGYLFLNERLGINELLGCCLMLAGMIISQIHFSKTKIYNIKKQLAYIFIKDTL